jgi:hypothetical protein
MRGKFRFKSNSALSIAMAAGLVLSGFGLGAVQAEAKGAANSPAFVKAAMPLQTKVGELEKLKAKPGSEAQLSAEATAAMPKPLPLLPLRIRTSCLPASSSSPSVASMAI